MTPQNELISGQRLAHYRILERVATSVYRAEDTVNGRTVAIKLLRVVVLGTEPSPSPQAPSLATAALTHPNICTVYSREEADGQTFLVMEFVEGASLQALSRQGLPFEQVLGYGRQLAAAVGYAHRKGVVHGNLKSSSVLVRSDGQVKILNFRIASASPADSDDIETLRYTAPEQLRGEAAAPPTDVWALGVMFWEMSSGEFPFPGNSATALRSAIVFSPLVSPPLSWPDRFMAVAFQCLSRSPEGRYRNGAALAADLKAIPLTAREHAWVRVRPAVIGVVALAVVIAVAVPAYKYLVAGRVGRRAPVLAEPFASAPAPVPTTTLAILPFKTIDASTRDVPLEFGLADALITSIGRLPGVTVRPSSAVIGYADHPADPATAGRHLRVDAVVDGSVQMIKGKVRLSARLFNVADGRVVWDETFVGDAADIVGARDAVTRRVAQSLAPQIAAQVADEQTRRALPNLDAYRAYLDGRYYLSQNTEPAVRRAIAQFERATAFDATFAPALAGIAEGQALLGIWGTGPVAATTERARGAALQAALADESLPEAHGSLALVKWAYDWNWERSESEFKRALELNPTYVGAHRWYAYMMASRGRFPEALAQLRRAGGLDPLSLGIRTDVAEIKVWAGELDAAVQDLRQIVDFDPKSARAHDLLGLTYVLQGRVSESIRALELARQLSDNPRTLSSLAYAHAVGGNRVRAESLLAELTSLSKSRYVSPLAFIVIYTGLDDRTRAFTWLDRALNERSDAIAIVEVNPWLMPLRSDARFSALLSRIQANQYQ